MILPVYGEDELESIGDDLQVTHAWLWTTETAVAPLGFGNGFEGYFAAVDTKICTEVGGNVGDEFYCIVWNAWGWLHNLVSFVICRWG